MRIGILTLPLHTNYGGILQAYALQTVLEGMGHEVVVINKHRVEPPTRKLYFKIIPRAISRYVLRKNVIPRYEFKRFRNYKVLSRNTQQFINKYIHSIYIKNLSGLTNSLIAVDGIVVGSDQIWRPKYIDDTLHDTVVNAYLDFAKTWDIKRLSYAASFGTENWEYTPEQTEIVSCLLKKFNAVSVREESGIKLCKEHLNVDAVRVLDPTMLLNEMDYSKLLENYPTHQTHKHILMNYVLDASHEKTMLINQVAKERGLTPYKLEVHDYADGKTTQPSVEEWLSSIKDADFVVTDSFHACVFSIIFHKPFIVIGNKTRGYGRFKSLMEMFHLTNNLITDVKEYDKSIDYNIPEDTYKVLKDKQDISRSFLINALS